MNTLQQFQYAEMMRQSRNAALYQIILSQGQGAGAGTGEEPVPPEPPAEPRTFIEFNDGTSEWYDLSGEISLQTMADIGLYDFDIGDWIKSPTNVKIGKNVTSIVDGAFSFCSNLTALVIPDSVTNIGSGVFVDSTLITSITIPDSVTSIGNSTFYGCKNLTDLTIPDSVTSIGFTTFYGCESLTRMIIPSSVMNIGNEAFGECSKLMSVTFENKTKSYVLGMDDFSWGLPSGCIITCSNDPNDPIIIE